MATSDTPASNYKVIYNFRVGKRSRRKLNDPPEAADVLERFGGAATTIAASVPKELIDEIRVRTGRREFSRFVATSLARELIDRSRADLVAEMEAAHGPVDADLVRALEDIFSK